MGEFKNKVVLITGGTSGIGKTTALAFAKEGAKVAISGRREKEGQEVAALISDSGGEGFFVKADVSDEAQTLAMVNQTVEKFGELQYAFANAGVWGDPKPAVDETKSNIDEVIDINVKGVLYTVKHVAPSIVAAGGGAIVTNASLLGLRPMSGFSVYNASKFAVVGYTRTVALELAEQGVRVNCVAPGPIETEMLISASDGDHTGFAQMLPMKRIGKPEEIADAVLWFCSERSSFVTGQTVAIDGGYCAG